MLRIICWFGALGSICALTAGCGGLPCSAPHLYTVRPDGSGRHRVSVDDGFGPVWLPGGGRLAIDFATNLATGRVGGYYAMNPDGSELRPLPTSRKAFAARATTRLSWVRRGPEGLIGFLIQRQGHPTRKVLFKGSPLLIGEGVGDPVDTGALTAFDL